MQEPIHIKKFKQLSTLLVKTFKLQKIDKHESLTFMHKNYHLHPSEAITLLVILLVVLILLLDGFNIVAAIVCFLLPLLQCLQKISAEEGKKPLSFVQLNISDQGSRLTDEQFSQIMSSHGKQHTITNIYIVYFIAYSALEVLSPVFNWTIGQFSWLLIRCLFTFAMLSKKTEGAHKVLSVASRFVSDDLDIIHRKAELFQRMK